MSFAQIKSELQRLSAEELRHLAMSSWQAYLQREQREPAVNECDENDPELLVALDEAVRRSDAADAPRHSGDDLRARLRDWTRSRGLGGLRDNTASQSKSEVEV